MSAASRANFSRRLASSSGPAPTEGGPNSKRYQTNRPQALTGGGVVGCQFQPGGQSGYPCGPIATAFGHAGQSIIGIARKRLLHLLTLAARPGQLYRLVEM